MTIEQNFCTQAEHATLRVIEIDPRTDLRWEALMTSLPTSPIYHRVWHEVMEEAYGERPIHLACEDATGQLVGILPLFLQQGWRSGRVLRSVSNGPLVCDERANAALLQAAIERVRNMPDTRLHLKLAVPTVDGLVGVPIYEIYVLALPERVELLHFDSSIRRAVNKAIRAGVQVREAETEAELRAWYQLYLETMRKLAVVPYPYRYYQVAWRRLRSKGQLRLLLAEQVEAGQRRLLGGILLLLYGQVVAFSSGAWREEDQALRANDILHWQAIRNVCAEGFRRYDFGNVDLDNPGLARYKRKWGAQSEMIYDYSYPVVPSKMGRNQGISRHPVRQLARAALLHAPIKALEFSTHWYYALHLY